MVGVAAEYNSACVNTLCRSWTVLNSPATRGFAFWWPFYYIKSGRIKMLDKELQINSLIGQNISIQRQAHSVSSADLALHIGMTSGQLQKIEMGESHVSAAAVKLISEYLGICPMVLYPADGQISS
jgi:hypothetical protein